MEYYEVLNQLAQGGQGITSRVKRKQDNAVLVLKQSFCDNAKAGNSALREAKTLQGLDHPHIVRYEDVFLTEDGRQLVVCLIMAYMEGGDMARYMITVKKHGMMIEPNRVVTWSKQMMSAIAYLHSSKIVHRDLKPQNVFMQDDNNLKIGDFGLAQTIERGKRTSHVGTPCYMAPEVLQNDAYADAVDVWGIGCILLEAVTLQFLWERKGMLAGQVLTDPVRADKLSTEFPLQLREVIAASLKAKPEGRPSAAMLLDVLENTKKPEPNALSDINQMFGTWQANATKAFSGLWLGAVKEEEEGPERAILSVAPPSRLLLPATQDLRKTQLEDAARREAVEAGAAARRTEHDRSPYHPPAQSPPAEPERRDEGGGGGEGANRGNWGGSFKDDQRGRVRGSPATLSQDVRGGELGGGRSPGYGVDARGTPASVLLGSAQASPYGASSVQGGSPGDYGGGGGGVMSVGARSVGGTTPQSAAQLQQTASQMSHKQQDLFGALPASKRRESSRGQGRGGGSSSDRGGGGGADVREYRKASDASASPESLIPQEVIEQYKKSGLFAVDAKWRGPLQNLMQSHQALALQSQMSRVGSDSMPASNPQSPPKKGGGFMRSLATSITGSGGSNKDEMQRAYSRGETLHQGVVSSIALASVASSTGEKKGKLLPGQTFEMSPSMRAAWQADQSDRNRGDVVRIVRKGQKEYELKFPSQNWEAARQACTGTPSDEEVQGVYLRMFGPPAKRFIGNVERLTAV